MRFIVIRKMTCRKLREAWKRRKKVVMKEKKELRA